MYPDFMSTLPMACQPAAMSGLPDVAEMFIETIKADPA
jgi:hypothetical protein